MKMIIALAALFAVALALPANDKEAYVVRQESDNIGLGAYRYAAETSNGIVAEEAGQLQNEGKEDEAIAVRGSFSYIGNDGVTYTVNYIADANGFQPQGAHLPQAP